MARTQLSVLSVEPYGMKPGPGRGHAGRVRLSVLSVEPYGMKRAATSCHIATCDTFSALGRAVWDETKCRI